MIAERVAKSEQGASAIIVASALLLLLGMAAVAVDLGAGFNERRQNQTAADLAAMAVVVEIIEPQVAVTKGIAVADANLEHGLSASEWQAAWESCADPERPTGFNPMPAPSGYSVTTLDCVSLNPAIEGRSEVRVRIPDMVTEAVFGRAVGVDQLVTHAVGHGAFELSFGEVLPFGFTNGTGDGTQCLTTSPSGNSTYPCDGPSSGNFGSLDIPLHGNPDKGTGTVTDCTPDLQTLASNVAIGLDHFISMTRPGMPGTGGPPSGWNSTVDDQWALRDECSSSSGFTLTDTLPASSSINTLRTRSGFVFQGIQAGLIGDIGDISRTFAGSVPRLQRLVDSSRYVEIRERGSSGTNHEWRLDNTPLWYYLRPQGELSSDGIPLSGTNQSCHRAKLLADPWPDNRDNFIDCLNNYMAWTPVGPKPPLFADGIVDNPRFAWAPEFHYTPFPSGSSTPMPILTFRPLYLDGLTFNCVTTGSTLSTGDTETQCDVGRGQDFSPGQYADGAAAKSQYTPSLRLDQVSTIVIPPSALPAKALATFPGLRGPFGVRLVR